MPAESPPTSLGCRAPSTHLVCRAREAPQRCARLHLHRSGEVCGSRTGQQLLPVELHDQAGMPGRRSSRQQLPARRGGKEAHKVCDQQVPPVVGLPGIRAKVELPAEWLGRLLLRLPSRRLPLCPAAHDLCGRSQPMQVARQWRRLAAMAGVAAAEVGEGGGRPTSRPTRQWELARWFRKGRQEQGEFSGADGEVWRQMGAGRSAG